MRTHRPTWVGYRLCALAPLCLTLACAFRDSEDPVLTADMPLHLEDHLDVASITGSEAPADPPQTVEWRFDQPQPDWKAAPPWNPTIASATVTPTDDAVRVTLTDRTRNPAGIPVGGLYVTLPDWDRREWSEILVRLRSDSSVAGVGVGFNLREGRGPASAFPYPFQGAGMDAPIVRDGSVQTYRLRTDAQQNDLKGPWRELGIWFRTDGKPGSVDVLSVSVIPMGTAYRDPPKGVRSVNAANRIRRALYVHTPARIAYRVRVPQSGRLDTSLGVLRKDVAVTFRLTVQTRGGEAVRLLDEGYSDSEQWAQRSVDLSKYAGQEVTIALETEAARPGTIALWGAPTVSGTRTSAKPNVIFYIIDGGGADGMSLYGYNRRTTPNLERLALEGAVFEHAYSTASWTKPSTSTFMTSLHHSVLGAIGDRFEPVPADARTMADRFHEAGYQTGVFSANPWSGSLSGLERSVDSFRDEGVEPNAVSTIELHREFMEWRDAYPGAPFWAHFQTTDVHSPFQSQPPFAGLFASPELKKQRARWESAVLAWRQRNVARTRGNPAEWERQWTELGIDRVQYHDAERAMWDEAMAHQDYQLGRFIEHLKETGDWENTILIVAADHSVGAGAGDFLVQLTDSAPPPWQWPIVRASVSHVPLLFVWPGHIRGGQRFSQAVSMIDVLPTVLELAGLPMPDVLQGQSLAPLLQERAGWRARPVIFDEFETDVTTGDLSGQIEMIDGRWGASLSIQALGDTLSLRPHPLLLFDVWNDPMAVKLMNDQRPDLVEKYTKLLEKQWEAHKLLAKRFTPGGKVELTPEQLETLRALGYIR